MRRTLHAFQFILPLLAFSFVSAHAFDAASPLAPIQLKDLPEFKPVQMSDIPDFMTEVETQVSKSGKVNANGLLATINYENFKSRKCEAKEEIIHLLPEDTGFVKEIPVRIFMQSGKAPLAVTLLGFGQSATDKLARAWQTYLYESGCHVLSFDSMIRNNMNEATGHGVAGNFVEESHVVAKIIDAVLNSKGKKEGEIGSKVSSIRLLGTSYGGLLSLQLLREPQAMTWPVDRCLVLSTPINMDTAAKRLDTFAREDKPFFGLMALMKLAGGYTPKNPTPSPEEEALMRAGLGYVFHGDLQGLAKSNISRYDPELPDRLAKWVAQPDQKDLHKDMMDTIDARQREEMKKLEDEYANKDKKEFEQAREKLKQKQKIQKMVAKREPNDIAEWNFQDYTFLLLKPYWKMKRGSNVPVTMSTLLAGAPNFVQVFVAADDPLNDPKELDTFREKIPQPLMTVLPHGGHLGYTGTQWVEALCNKFFGAKK